jgi:hypothetical protein
LLRVDSLLRADVFAAGVLFVTVNLLCVGLVPQGDRSGQVLLPDAAALLARPVQGAMVTRQARGL